MHILNTQKILPIPPLHPDTGPKCPLQSMLQQLPDWSVWLVFAVLHSIFHTAAWTIFLTSTSEQVTPKFITDGETKQKLK